MSDFIHCHVHTEFCLGPDTLVAMADLQWRKASDIKVGDDLVGFGEDLTANKSRMCHTTVEGVKTVQRDCYRITLEDGTSIISSAQHGWVTVGSTRGSQIRPGGPSRSRGGGNARHWLTTEELRPGSNKLVLWAKPWTDLPQCAPVRLKPRSDELWVGRKAGSKNTKPILVTSLEYLGEMETVAIQTTTGTLVAEGFLSHNSLLDGASKIEDAVQCAVQDGQPGMAITDHGHLYGAIPFYKECREQGINPIIGIETYHVDDRLDKSKHVKRKGDEEGLTEEGKKARYHLSLMAENATGYKNLIQISSRSFLEGFKVKGRTDWELLENHHEGVIATTGCLGGMVLQDLMKGDIRAAEAHVGRLQDIFGKSSLYVEIQDHGIPEQANTMRDLIAVARKMDAPLLATNDSHYCTQGDAENHDALICLNTGSLVKDKDRFRFHGDQHYIKSALEMRTLFRDLPNACDSSLEINERSNLIIPFGERHLPKFEVPAGYLDDNQYLAHLVIEGAEKRYGQLTDVVLQRLVFELKTIQDMDLSSYFLILWDIVKYAHSQNIATGPGRGSAAGSAVAYSLKITDIDPIKYDLLFERFLNPHRVSNADIDLDMMPSGRETLINYVAQKYGEDHVCQIITYNTIKSRAAVRNAARVLGHPYAVGDRIAKALPPVLMGRVAPLAASFQKQSGWAAEYDASSALRAMCNTSPSNEVVRVALGLEGLRSGDSIHAAAVVIGDAPITDYLPVQQKGDGAPIVSQYEMGAVEDLGLLKMDFLGLRTLDVIDRAKQHILRNYNLDVVFDEPYDDFKTYELLRSGNSSGVFQLESRQMQDLLRRLRPTSFADIAAVVALYRPGPMAANMHNDYADRKNGRQAVTYFHPDAEVSLGETYGLCIFQEQVMALARQFAGFSLAEADTLRRAMGKKKRAEMDALKVKFIEGCAISYTETLGEELFEIIEKFADYSFARCLTEDTRIQGPSGCLTIKEVSDRIELGESVYLNSFQFGSTVSDRCVSVIDSGIQQVYLVALDDGSSIEATLDHKFLCVDGLYYTLRDIYENDLEMINENAALKIASVEPLGERQTFSVEMESDPHNYVLENGAVSKNSHAYPYGLLSYMTAYLKAHYPTEYMAAVTTGADKQKMIVYLGETARLGVTLRCPDINKSHEDYWPLDDEILVGIGSVREVSKVASAIVEERTSNGEFLHLADFILRCQPIGLNAKGLTSLAQGGAFDCFGMSRLGIASSTKEILASLKKRAKKANQVSLFAGSEADNVSVPKAEYDTIEQMHFEKHALGVYVSSHPMDAIGDWVETNSDMSILELTEAPEDERIRVVGVISDLVVRNTKAGLEMAIFELSDRTGSIEAVIYPKIWNKLKRYVRDEEIISAVVRAGSDYRDERNYGISDITPYVREREVKDAVRIHVPRGLRSDPEMLSRLKGTLLDHRGDSVVHLHISRSAYSVLDSVYGAVMEESLVEDLKRLFKEYRAQLATTDNGSAVWQTRG